MREEGYMPNLKYALVNADEMEKEDGSIYILEKETILRSRNNITSFIALKQKQMEHHMIN